AFADSISSARLAIARSIRRQYQFCFRANVAVGPDGRAPDAGVTEAAAARTCASVQFGTHKTERTAQTAHANPAPPWPRMALAPTCGASTALKPRRRIEAPSHQRD